MGVNHNNISRYKQMVASTVTNSVINAMTNTLDEEQIVHCKKCGKTMSEMDFFNFGIDIGSLGIDICYFDDNIFTDEELQYLFCNDCGKEFQNKVVALFRNFTMSIEDKIEALEL